MNSIEDVSAYLEKAARLGIRPGLAAITSLMLELGNPQKDVNCVHIAGTNGKGSTAAFIAAALNEAGYSVGRFLSPAIKRVNEMIVLQDSAIEDAELVSAMGEVAEANARVEKELGYSASEFELLFAAAMLYFKKVKADMAVLECGMGGRLDATNIVKPLLSVITPIAMDHQSFLGSSIEEIAAEKAGIIKPYVPLVLGIQDRAAASLIKSRAFDLNSVCEELLEKSIKNIDLYSDKTSFEFRNREYSISLLGTHQVYNASLAIMALDSLVENWNFSIEYKDVKRAFSKVSWGYRFEKICEKPLVIVDGAHNPAGILALKSALLNYYPNRHLVGVFSVMKDKAVGEMLVEISDLFQCFILHASSMCRAMPARDIASELLKSAYKGKIKLADNMDEVLSEVYSYDDEHKHSNPVFIKFGSLYTIADFVDAIEIKLLKQG